MGSELIHRGETLPNHIWSADSNFNNPELVYQIHKDYIDAGSNYITTNTFRTTPRAYKKTGLSQSDSIVMAHRSLRIAVRLANKAANNKLKILGSIAPLEDCYEPKLFPGEKIAKNEFRQIGAWLVDEGIHIFLIETMNSISETRACLDAVFKFNIPIWVSFVLKNSMEILSGEKLVDAIRMIENYDVDCVLLNCNPIHRTIDAMNIVAKNWKRDWGIYPNLGFGEPSPDGIINQIYSDEEYISVIDKSIKLGANMLGGCCGSSINHIKLIADYIKK
jgi:S-methylmethionine-dependent homocysteine/selenocysteine methylase